MERWSADLKRERGLAKEVVAFLQKKDLSVEEALKVLREAQRMIERASLKNKI